MQIVLSLDDERSSFRIQIPMLLPLQNERTGPCVLTAYWQSLSPSAKTATGDPILAAVKQKIGICVDFLELRRKTILSITDQNQFE